MKVGKLLFVWVFFMIAAIVSSATILFAAEPPGAGGSPEKIIGPAMWAVCVIDCTGPSANIRVKKIEGCDVDTQAVTESSLEIIITTCPPPEGEIVYTRFNASEIFGLPCQPIVTKTKNYKIDGPLVSFDAQIQFVVPDTYNGEQCQ